MNQTAKQPTPQMTLASGGEEIHGDHVPLVRFLRAAGAACAKNLDVATTGLSETWIDESERRAWFPGETSSEG